MADFEGQYIQELPETEELNDTDSFINENNTPKTQRTTWGTIWQAIKDKILTWTYEQLTTDNQTLPGGINELKKAVDELNTNLSDKVISETKHVTTSSNWVVVTKTGYFLANAYNIRNDTTNPISSISKRVSGDSYTVVISNASNSEVDLYLVWAKKPS
jgi:hypothetical protein